MAEQRIVPDVVRQHAEQAAFFWAQRDMLMAEDPPDRNAVAGVDKRLEANLDGLRIAGAAARPFVLQQHEDFPEKGELFVVGWMAIEQNNKDLIVQAVEFGRKSGDDARGLVGALAWMPPERIGGLVRDWIVSADAFKRLLAVSACVEHGVDPKQLLTRLVRDPNEKVRAKSICLVGKLKRADFKNELQGGLHDEDGTVRFWAAWALTELGFGELAGTELKKVATGGDSNALAALRAVVRAQPDKDVRAWMGGLLKSPETAPLAVRGAGMLGDRTILHWLIHQMRDPALAVAAGSALLETFPEAREADDLFTLDPSDLGQAFQDHFGDFSAKVPIANKVKDWASGISPKKT